MPTNPNIIKIVDLGGGGDFSSLAAFIAWLRTNYNPLDRNACAICRVTSGNTYGDSASWGSLPSFSGDATILIETTKEHWFNGIFSSTRYYIATNPTQPTYWYQLIFHRVQIGAPDSPITGTIKAGLFLCGVVSSATTVVQADVVANSMIVCTTNNQTGIDSSGAVVTPSIIRNLVVTRPNYTGYIGIYTTDVNSQIVGNHVARFQYCILANGYTYYNSATGSISPDTQGNRTNQTPTFVDETNWNYILSINDTSAKDYFLWYKDGGLPVSLYYDGITGYRFPFSSIGPTDPDPGTYAPWLTKVVNTDGGGDFTSLNAAFVWLRDNYPDLITSNIRVKFICRGTTSDSTAVTATLPTTDPRHYIHVIAHDEYRFTGRPNLSNVYKRSYIQLSRPAPDAPTHVIFEGIQIDQSTVILTPLHLFINCYLSLVSSLIYGNFVNCIIYVSTTAPNRHFYNSLMNCTIYPSDYLPFPSVSINCIFAGSNSGNSNWYLTLGSATAYGARTSLYCKFSQNIIFVDPANYDYRLSWTDTAARQQGVYTGSYLEGVTDVKCLKRPPQSSYGADEPSKQCPDVLHGSDLLMRVKRFVDWLFGYETIGYSKVVETLYCVAESIYRGALSGRILIRVQKKTSRIYRI